MCKYNLRGGLGQYYFPSLKLKHFLEMKPVNLYIYEL